MKLNLQFFADEEVSIGAEESEAATPVEVEGTDVDSEVSEETEATESTTEAEEPEEQTVDVNAIAAAARRKAEAEIRALKETQAKTDAEYVRRFGNFKNPITGEPIRSQADYLAALDAQEQIKNERVLREKGVDPSIINDLVARNPIVVEASQYLATAKERETMALIDADVQKLAELDPNIHSLDDVPANVIQTAIDKGYTLVDAYKVENYGKMTSQKAEAIRQGAINQAKGKAHLAPVNGVAVTDNSVEIPQNLRAMWEEAFPNKTWAERKALYNEQLK